MSLITNRLAFPLLFGGRRQSITHILDEFTDPNGTLLSNHAIAPINLPGAVWIKAIAGGVNEPTIYNNRVEFEAVQGNFQIAYFNSGEADLTISAIWRVTASDTFRGAGLIGRCSTGGNGWLAWAQRNGDFNLYEISSWALGTLRASDTITPVANTDYEFSLNFNGTMITATFDGIPISYESSLYQAQTHAAVRNYNGTLDNLKVVTPPF